MHDKMDTNTSSRLNPTHVQWAKMARFSVQDGCIIFDMDVLDIGLLAVAGYKQCTHNTFIDLFNLDIETDSHEKALLKESKPYYSKEFTSLGANHRCFCFLTDVSFVTCCKDKIETYNTEINNGGLVKEQCFEGEALSMALRDGSVYVGLSRSSDVIVFDLDLNQVKRIVVAGFGSLECPWDILVRNDTLFLCTFWSRRIVVFDSKSSGFWQLPDSEDSIAHDCTTPRNQHYAACSIAFSEQNSLLFILRVGSGNSFVEVYLFPSDLYTPSGYTFCAAFNVPVDSIRIRFNETVNSLFVVTQKTGEVFEYDIYEITKDFNPDLEYKINDHAVEFFALSQLYSGRMFESFPDVSYQAQFPGETLPAPSHDYYGRVFASIQDVKYQAQFPKETLSAPSHDHGRMFESIQDVNYQAQFPEATLSALLHDFYGRMFGSFQDVNNQAQIQEGTLSAPSNDYYGRMFESIPDVNYQAQFPGETSPAPLHDLYGRMFGGFQDVKNQAQIQEVTLSAPSHDYYGRIIEGIQDVKYQTQIQEETLSAPSHDYYGRIIEGIQDVKYQTQIQEETLSAPSHDYYGRMLEGTQDLNYQAQIQGWTLSALSHGYYGRMLEGTQDLNYQAQIQERAHDHYPPDVLTLLHESLQKIFAEMTRSDSENLANFFMFPLKHVKAIINSPSHSKDLLVELENKGIIQSALIDELFENLGALNIKLLTGRSEGSKSSIRRHSPTFLWQEEDWNPPDTMKITSSISRKGGLLQIPNSGIKLVFPPNAVTKEHNIQVKIVPPSLLNEPATSFSSNSSVVLELLPNGLQLKREVSLTLPHCLTFINEEKAKAKVYVSHHEEGQRPRWEERPLSPYIFHRSKCTVRLFGFCWVKIVIDDKEVEAKNIVVFATKDILQDKKTANLEVGYYEDIPDRGEPNILELNPDMKPEKKLKLKVLKEGKQPLTISFNGTDPGNTWAIEQDKPKKEISWQSIAGSEDRLVSFVLHRKQAKDSFCNVSAQQGNSDPIIFVLKLEVNLSTVESLDRKVPDSILKELARKLTGEWQMLARELNISECDLYNIKENNTGNIVNTKYFMLSHWSEMNGTGATCRVLAEALGKVKRTDLWEIW